MVRFLFSWALASLIGGAAAIAASSHFVLQGLAATGVEFKLADRLGAFFSDLQGFGPLFLAIVAGAGLVLFGLAAFIGARARGLAFPLAIAAGIAATLGVVFALQLAFGVPVVAGARGMPGQIAIAAAGALGGLVFFLLNRPRNP